MDTSKKKTNQPQIIQLPNELIKAFFLITFKLVENLLVVHLFTEQLSYESKPKGKQVYFPCYLPFHHFFTIPFTISITLISRVFDSALTQNYSPSSTPPSLLMAFSASPLSEGEAQCPRSGHYPCENIRSWFLSLPAHVWSVPLTRQSSPQSQPEASSPEHWVPWIQGLCLFSSAHPFQTHISQA